MYYVGRRLTREEKRRVQRLRANLTGAAVILLLLAAGFTAGKLF